MTVRQIYQALLVELNKVGAPSLLLEDFNYFLKKAIYLYSNKRYGLYDVSLQTTDDLRALKITTILDAEKVDSDITGFSSTTYKANLPEDYFHLLNCICIYTLDENYKCYKKGDKIRFPAKRLTSDTIPTILEDYYNRPLPYRPYFFVHDIVETTSSKPKDPDSSSDSGDLGNTSNKIENFSKTISLRTLKETEDNSNIEDSDTDTTKKSRKACIEIEYGNDSIFKLEKILIDYLKVPEDMQLTLDLMNSTQDTTPTLEFPEYACHEIINELVMLVMANIADPRLPSNTQVSQSIVNPVQQLAQ